MRSFTFKKLKFREAVTFKALFGSLSNCLIHLTETKSLYKLF